MNKTPKNLEQKIDLIEGMMSVTQNNYAAHNASTMIMIGWLVVVPNLLLFFSSYLNFKPLILLDLVFIAVFLFFFIKRLSNFHNRSRQRLYLNKMIGHGYIGLFLSFLTVIISFYIIFGHEAASMPHFGIAIFSMYGGAFFINARLAGIKWLWLLSLPTWMMVFAIAFLGYHENTLTDWRLINAVSFLFGSLLPGYIIKYRDSHEKPQTP